ncbi:LASP1 protein, partial [Atractosteus spatula]|nr:LASP1 protein [Atractosteus spatula]
MTLNMKNYKGFEKKPYCNAHYPKTTFTSVADTPENLRLKQQSKMQSQVLYKEEFEKNKGKGFSVVADTPELQRIKKTQDQISNEPEQHYLIALHVRLMSAPRMEASRREEGSRSVDEKLRIKIWVPELPDVSKPGDVGDRIKYHEDFEKSRMGGEGHSQTPPPHGTPADTLLSLLYAKETRLISCLFLEQFYPLSVGYHQQPGAPQNFNFEPTPEPPRQAAAAPPSSAGKRYRAVYDYVAADEDEVSFQDGDMILDVQQIDEGWMYGRVERTGQQGMLPANYVEAI